MPANAITHFVFVDFENVPEVDLGPVDGKPVHVTLLIGKNQRRLDLALVRHIHRLAAQVELVEVGASGRNALDLTLACYLGLAVQRTPAARFCIVSKDRDFEPMIEHLSGKGIKVARYGDFHLLPFLAPAGKPAARPGKQPEDRRARVIARLRNPASRNRPSSRKALLAHIKASLGKEASEAGAGDILRELCEKSVLTIDSRDKVSYLT